MKKKVRFYDKEFVGKKVIRTLTPYYRYPKKAASFAKTLKVNNRQSNRITKKIAIQYK